MERTTTEQAEGLGTLVRIPAGSYQLEGDLQVPPRAQGLVLFAHGSGSSRRSPRNRAVAEGLNKSGLATLLFDLLSREEERVDQITAQHRFDIPLLAQRLVDATDWVVEQRATRALPVGYFGASTGAAAALVAAAARPKIVRAVVARGGRPDLAGPALAEVRAATLLIVGGEDHPVIGLNRQAFLRLNSRKDLAIVPGAGHLFEEPGAMAEVVQLAEAWFLRFLTRESGSVRLAGTGR